MKIEIPPFENLDRFKNQLGQQSNFTLGTVHGVNELIRSVCSAYPHKMAFSVLSVLPPPFDGILKKLKGEGYQMQEVGLDLNFDTLKRDTLFCFTPAVDPITGILAPIVEINKKCEAKGIISLIYFSAAYLKNLNLPEKPSAQEAWLVDPLAYDEEISLIVKGDRVRIEGLLWGEIWISDSKIEKLLQSMKVSKNKSQKERIESFEKKMKGIFGSEIWTVSEQHQRIWDRSVCSLSGVNGEALAHELKSKGFEISTASACFWNRPWPFNYLKGFGLTDEQIQGLVMIPSEYLDQKNFESTFQEICKKLKSFSS